VPFYRLPDRPNWLKDGVEDSLCRLKFFPLITSGRYTLFLPFSSASLTTSFCVFCLYPQLMHCLRNKSRFISIRFVGFVRTRDCYFRHYSEYRLADAATGHSGNKGVYSSCPHVQQATGRKTVSPKLLWPKPGTHYPYIRAVYMPVMCTGLNEQKREYDRLWLFCDAPSVSQWERNIRELYSSVTVTVTMTTFAKWAKNSQSHQTFAAWVANLSWQ